MYAKKARIGLLIPSLNVVAEQDFFRLLPDGYQAISTRIRFEGGGKAGLARMNEEVSSGTSLLVTAGVDAVGFICTSGSFIDGPEGEQKLIESIRSELPETTPVITTSYAIVDALKHMDISRIALVTPYGDDLNALEVDYFQSAGLDVKRFASLYVGAAVEAGRQDDDAAYNLARQFDRDDLDAIVISCTNLPAIDAIDRLEKETGLPVITSNQATLWQLLRALGWSGSLPGYGALLRDNL
ncbi:aspartate/glutamate racemase family protein [Microbacterium sp. SSW1-49]|uniref:Aspartate/glutamate racemase family protein n=1 Tax=Microbacterium croceum TaxID=2851645 RepID=A0ABT0FCC5_9MICO|nr:aspartate/glutamate racemase family protein [Microbacterium croceum]MCK2035721.1 aspartate/glutamate racemase family protein [Microbacterium croceum]